MNYDQFLLWERATQDTLDLKKIYIDMADDLVAGIVLSQIVYWHLPSRNGNSKLRVQKDGYMWIAKGSNDWYPECRITKWQAPRALKLLEDKQLIITKLYKFNGAATTHIRINTPIFMSTWAQLVYQTDPDLVEPTASIEAFPQSRMSENTNPLTENTTENTYSKNIGLIQDPAGDTVIGTLEVSDGKGKITIKPITKADIPVRTTDQSEDPQTRSLHRTVYGVLKAVTGLDDKLASVRGRLNRATKELVDAGYGFQDVRAFLNWWKLNDFRWQRSKRLPTPENVVADISRSKQQVDRSEATRDTSNDWQRLQDTIAKEQDVKKEVKHE
jgi:hypothetical protein